MRPIGSMRHEDFTIGEAFWTAGGPYRCTDVGTRTIVAVHLGPRVIVQQESVGNERRVTTLVVDDPSWLNGPAYAVAEVVFDEDDMGRHNSVFRPPGRTPSRPASTIAALEINRQRLVWASASKRSASAIESAPWMS